MKEFDLSRSAGCRENPVALLIEILNSGNYNEFVVVTKKTVLPVGIVRVIASKKGYEVEIVYELGDQVKYAFKKSATRTASTK